MINRLLPLAALLFATAAGAAGFAPLDRAAARDLGAPERQRQPTVVALWSSDCVHCKKNLALFASLAKANPRLRVVTVATEPASPALEPLLDKTGIAGERYAYGNDAPEAIAYALDPAWAGELPRTLLFDGRGGVRKISGVLDQEQALRALSPR